MMDTQDRAPEVREWIRESTNKSEEPKKVSNVGRLMGQISGLVIGLCLCAILIALTVKFIMWII